MPAPTLGATNATLNAMVNPEGKETTVFFEFGQTTAYGSSTVEESIGAGTVPVSISADISGLLPNTLYDYRVVVITPAGATNGPAQTFMTSNTGSTGFVANNDDALITGKGAITIDVLANDTGPDGFPLEVTAVTQPAYGTVTIGPDGLLTYTPKINFANFAGTDSFTYSLLGLSTAVVTVGNPFNAQIGRFAGVVGNCELTVTVTGDAGLTGTLRNGAASINFKGSFDGTGTYNGFVAGQYLTLQIGPAFPAASSIPPGTMNVTYAASVVSIYRAMPYTAANPAPEAGTHTMLLPAAVPTSGTVPSGTGIGSLKVSTTGGVTISGVLADGTPFSQSGFVTSGGTAGADLFPIYASLPYKARGLLSGTIAFEKLSGTSDFDGTVAWVKPPQTTGKLYPGGFNTGLAAIGSIESAPLKGTLALALGGSSPNATLTLNEPDFSTAITKQVTVLPGRTAATNTVTVNNPSTDKLTMSIDARAGTFAGTFIDPLTLARTKFRGVLFQDQASAAGFFTSPTQSGAVSLLPAQ
jgi:hypothetical protein